ncbi:MAG: hypothetical protein K8R11_12625 [Methanococcoides sp.]|nr:hypothetical protein [Methanococcoides sp.]
MHSWMSHYQSGGSTIEDDYEFIVVSPETNLVALKINEIRKAAGRAEIKILSINYVMADDDLPISYTYRPRKYRFTRPFEAQVRTLCSY